MVDGYKDAFDAAKQACDTAIAAASTNLHVAFMAIKAQLQHGSTDARLQRTFRHVQVDMEADIARMLISMRDAIVGRPPPPPTEPPAPPAAGVDAAAAGAGAAATGAGAAAEAMVEGDDGVGPLNQEAAATRQAAAAPILTKAEVEQLIATALQKQANASRKSKPQHHTAQQKPRPQQRQQHQRPYSPRQQYAVLRQPSNQGFMHQPGRQQPRPNRPQPARQRRHSGTHTGRRQPQQQSRQQPAFHTGPPGFRGYWHPDNAAVPGDQPINGHAIPRGHNGGRRSTRTGYATGGGFKPRKNRQVRFY